MNVAINGLGRIGRAFLRRTRAADLGVTVVAVNDLAPVDQLAYLLRYDSAHGRFPGVVEAATGSSTRRPREASASTPSTHGGWSCRSTGCCRTSAR